MNFRDPDGLESADAAYSYYSARDNYLTQFSYPLKSGTITSASGERPVVKDSDTGAFTKPIHDGIDIANKTGTNIYPAADGTVKDISYNRTFGLTITLSHNFGIETKYSHQDLFPELLSKGDALKKDSVLGKVGDTGLASGPHVDFQIKADGTFKDPSDFIQRPESIVLDRTSVKEDQNGKITNILKGK